MAAAGTTVPDLERGYSVAVSREIVATGVVGMAILAAIGLRWFRLDGWSLWWDEGFTLWASNLSPAHIIPFAKSDNQAPLYYLLQHYWGLVFGDSEFALRALSAFFGTLCLPVFYLLAKKVLKDSLAVALGMWLFAFSMKQIWYSREARTYEAAAFFALLALYALVLFLEKRKTLPFVLIVISSAITLYLHNMMFFYLFALNLTWLVYPSERGWWQRIKELLLADICIGFLILPWILSLFAQVAAVSGNLWWVPKPTLRNLFESLRDIAGIDMSYLGIFIARRLPLATSVQIFTETVGVILLCVASLVGGFWGDSSTDRRKYLSLLSYALVPILLVFLLSQGPMRLYVDRVFTASSIVVPLIFAFPLATRASAKSHRFFVCIGIGLAAITALSGFGFVRYREALVRNGEDWRDVAAVLHNIPESNRLIVFVPPAGEIFFDSYGKLLPSLGSGVATTGLPGGFHERFPPPKAKVVDTGDINRLKQAVEAKKYAEIDLVLTHDVDPHGLLYGYLGREFVRQEELPSGGTQIKIVPFRSLPAPESSPASAHPF
jgi:4-amino-4-deoxy-L-arabinose transferase-like glycosyltransferase